MAPSFPARAPVPPRPRTFGAGAAALVAVVAVLGFAAPASADVLVSNFAESLSSTAFPTHTWKRAQGFTPGMGATLTSIELRFHVAPDSSTTVQVVTGIPGSTAPTVVATLTHPATLGTGDLTFTAPAGTTLIAQTEYFVTVAGTGSIRVTSFNGEDSGSKPGWSVANKYYAQNIASPGDWETISSIMAIRVNGMVSAGPTVARAKVLSDGTKLMLAFDRDLDESSTPANSDFAVTVAGAARGVTNVDVSGRTVTLTLASAVAATDAVTVSYTRPTTGTDNRIRSTGGVEAASFSGQAASHNQAPVFTPDFLTGGGTTGET